MMAQLENERMSIEQKGREMHIKGIETLTRAVKNLADAEAAEVGPQLDIYKAELSALMNDMKQQNNQQVTGGQINASTNDRTGIQGMGTTSGNEAVLATP